MRVFAVAVTISIVIMVTGMQSQTQLPDYKNSQLPVDRRVADLLGRMTLEEKVAQLVCLWTQKPQVGPQRDFSTDRGDFSPDKAGTVMKNGIGQISRQRERKDARNSAIFANAVQKFLVEQTRLGIPAMFHDEALHGHMAQGSTHFPQPIALAASWDLELIGQVFTVAALEARSRPLPGLADGCCLHQSASRQRSGHRS
jgi:beta-glucosidase